MCAVNGELSIVFVPHVNRQEVYAGDLDKETAFFDGNYVMREHSHVAPVNFFIPDLNKYPYFSGATRQQVNLATGDCVFIPAYYFYHLQGYTTSELPSPPTLYKRMDDVTIAKAEKETYGDGLATAISLKF